MFVDIQPRRTKQGRPYLIILIVSHFLYSKKLAKPAHAFQCDALECAKLEKNYDIFGFQLYICDHMLEPLNDGCGEHTCPYPV